MYLLQPLRMSFELNYVAPHAQGVVPVPEGLNLDSWIVPPPKIRLDEEPVPKQPKKSKSKGKEKVREKDGDVTKKRTKKKIELESQETAEEKAAREKVCPNFSM
jgi:AP-3 complex subunit delta-1